MKIGSFDFEKEQMPFFVAEIGHNHMGNIEIAKDLIKAAKKAGAHAVKLQKRDNKKLFTKKLYESPYDNENSYGDTYGLHREFLEFGYAEYLELQEYAKEQDIIFFATAFDIGSADFLADLNMPAFKIAAACYNDIPLIKHIAQDISKPLIISIPYGVAKDSDIRKILDVADIHNLVLLHCVPEYPTPAEHLNLENIKTLKNKYPIKIGLSDHYAGILSALFAYHFGPVIIEKHFTLNRAWKGTDHKFSLEPKKFANMVQAYKELDAMRTNELDYASIFKSIRKMGKSIYPAKTIPAGIQLQQDDLVIKSPSLGGLEPYEFENLIGKITLTELSTASDIKKGDIKND